jgi:predicted transposase YbfD/YdcC
MLNNLIKKLPKIKDFRKDKGKRHHLTIVIIIMIIGNMLGFMSYRALGRFTRYYAKQLCSLLKITSEKLPSYSTIRRVALGINNQELIEQFNQWGEELMNSDEIGECFAIDGKSLRNTVTEVFNEKQNFVMFSSLFDSTNKLVLKIKSYENKKTSEIKETQELISNVPITNKTFTLDALHCQKETVRIIIEGKNDYLIPVKKNQKTLYNSLEKLMKETLVKTVDIQLDHSHGRKIKRQVSVWDNYQDLPQKINNKFQEIKNIIKVERSGIRGKKQYEETVYYISSKSETATEVGKKIKNHWGIENQLHWVKDVVMEEDISLIKNEKAAINISVIKSIGINFFRLLKFESITEGRTWLGANLSGFFAFLK